jgi:iron(III) transport system ATP-binding protein
MPASNPIMEVKELQKIYANLPGGRQAGLVGASFALQKGAFFTLLGPSGCGKTTTLRCIAGLETPSNGIIRVDGDAIFDAEAGTDIPLNLRNFGMVFQSYAIWPHMSVFENVAFPMRVAKDQKYSEADIRKSVNEALETVSLPGFGDRSATRLSGGQQQRVALARAIVRRPKLLLLDEPLSNLDATLREEMRNELRRLQQQIGVTTIYVTHDQTEALEMSDLIAVMHDGHIVQLDEPRAVYFEPANSFVAGFVGTTNWLYGTYKGLGSNGFSAVLLASGETIYCAPRQGVSEAQSVKISIRPEAITIINSKAEIGNPINRLAGTVIFAGFMGNMTRCQIKVGEHIIQAYGEAHAKQVPGVSSALEFHPANAVLFLD